MLLPRNEVKGARPLIYCVARTKLPGNGNNSWPVNGMALRILDLGAILMPSPTRTSLSAYNGAITCNVSRYASKDSKLRASFFVHPRMDTFHIWVRLFNIEEGVL